MTDIPHNDLPPTAYTIPTASGHRPRRRREERRRLLGVSHIGNSSDRDGEDFDVFAFGFEFHSERAAHRLIEGFGPAVYRRIRDAGVGEPMFMMRVGPSDLASLGRRALVNCAGNLVDIDQETELFRCVLFQRLDFGAAADVVDEDGEIETVEVGYEVINLLTCSRGVIEYGGFELNVFVFALELGFGLLELFGVSAVQNDVETIGGKF